MKLSAGLEGIKSNATVRKASIGIVVFLLVFSITGFFILPPILKSVITKKLSEELHRKVSIKQVKVNPFVLSVTLRGFLVNEEKSVDAFASFDELYVNLQSISVLKRGLVLSEVRVDKPYVNIRRNEDGSYNFSDLLESKPKKEAGTPRFSFNNIQMLNGSIDFFDGPKHTRHKVRDMDIKIPFISNLPYNTDIYVQPSFQAKVNDTPVVFQGKTKPFKDSHETHFEINIDDLDIPYYMAYSPFKAQFKVPSGFLDINAAISYAQYKDKPPSLDLTGDIVLKKIRVIDLRDNPLISLPFFKTSFARSDLIAKRVHLSGVMLKSPELNIAHDRSGKINLMVLLPERKPAEQKPAKEEVPLSLDADVIQIADGKIMFSDSLKTGTFKTTLGMIDVGINNLSTTPDKKAEAHLSFSTESGESAKLQSEFSINPFMSGGSLELKQIKLRKYSPYYSERVLFDIGSGGLDLSTKYIVKKSGNEYETELSELSAILTSLRLKKRGEKDDFLNIPSVSLNNTSAFLAKKEVSIGMLSTKNGILKIRRYQDGKINVLGLVPESPDSGVKPGKPGKPVKGKEFLVALKKIAAENYTVKVEDSATQEPVSLLAQKINFRGSDISTAKNSKGKASLSFLFNKKGAVATNGSVGINPVSADMKLIMKDIEIAPLQAYFTDRVKILITQGNISADGHVSVGFSKNGAMNASCKGEASITKFNSLDKANADEFLKWDSLHFGGINATYNPIFVSIDKVALTDFYSRVIINKDGSMNLQGIVREKGTEHSAAAQAEAEKPAAEAKPELPEFTTRSKQKSDNQKPAGIVLQPNDVTALKKPEKLIKIDSVTLQGGTINFSDRHIQPNYSSNFLELGGKISGLSSEESKFADVDLRGKLEDYAPLEITGKINPLRDDLYVDLKIDFKNMDLSPVTPYSGRYLGYTIQKGALSLNLQYLIVKNKLESQNNIFLDQFTLGDRVESPHATKLPVRLAIALLKNRKGEIDLNIPVTGYIDDPKFSVGRIVIKILLNLLAKAATSPFALLGALFGGGEELSYVEFDPGSLDLSDQSIKKLDTLVKALSDRPGLRLEIEGHADVDKDREGLKQYLFMKKIKAQKLKELVKKGQPAVPVDQITIPKEEYAKYLKMAYKEEEFPKPRTMLLFVKDLPVPEMEKLMLTHIVVGDNDLRQLASQRALKIKDYILKSGKVTADRVFLVEPKSLEPEKKDKLKNSRVDFRLK